MEYLTTEIELVLDPTFWTVHKIIEYLTLGLFLAYFILSHPVVTLV